MSTDEFLTKDEVDALKQAMSSKPAAQSRMYADEPEEVLTYELGSSENTITGILPILDAIHERFAHRFRIGLFELLHRDVEVTVDAVEMRDYGDFIASLNIPTSVNIVAVSPLNGPGLVVFEQGLIFAVVDTFFGGKGRMENPLKVRDFTTIETRFIQRLLQLTARALEAVWQPFIAIGWSMLGAENNPQFVTAINPQEVLMVVTLHIHMNGVTGVFHMAWPCAMFEPVRATLLASLRKEHASRDERLTQRLREGVKNSHIEVRGLLAETELTVAELLALKVGDFIALEVTHKAILEAEGVAVYAGQYGAVQGRRAVRVEQVLTPLEDNHQAR